MSVEKLWDELWIGVKCQSNTEIAGVGSPDPNSDEYVPIDVTIDNQGRLHITDAVELDTGSDQVQPAKPKTEDEMAEEEGM